MSKKIPLASVTEELLQLSHSPEESGASQVQTRTQEKKEQVLSLVRTEIEKCLVEQRAVAHGEPRIKGFRELNPHTQTAHMESMPARLFYYLQRVFSLPEDYMELTEKTSRNREKELIASLVFHPEFLTDDFLIALGVCKKEDLHCRRLGVKIDQRISVIPQIKEAFTHTEQLPYGNRGHTARIVSFNDPGKPWDGKYILFQERSNYEVTAEGKKRKTLRITPNVFDDIFALARSQEKAIKSISLRSVKIESLKEKIDSLLLRWYSLADEERKTEIANLREELHGKQTFHEISALKGRIEKIDFSHPQVSTGRLIGAWNDLMQSYGEKTGKVHTISEQTGMLRSIIRMETSRFETVYQEFLSMLNSLNHTEIDKSVQAYRDRTTEKLSLPPQIRAQFRAFLPTLREYTELYGRQRFVGLPFSTIHNFIEYVYGILKDDTSEDRKIVQTLFIATLYLKLYRVQIGLYSLKDRLKSIKTIFPIDEKRRIMENIKGSLQDLQTTHILGSIPLGDALGQKFTQHIEFLEDIRRLFEQGDVQGVLDIIDNLFQK